MAAAAPTQAVPRPKVTRLIWSMSMPTSRAPFFVLGGGADCPPQVGALQEQIKQGVSSRAKRKAASLGRVMVVPGDTKREVDGQRSKSRFAPAISQPDGARAWP